MEQRLLRLILREFQELLIAFRDYVYLGRFLFAFGGWQWLVVHLIANKVISMSFFLDINNENKIYLVYECKQTKNDLLSHSDFFRWLILLLQIYICPSVFSEVNS